MKLMKRKSMGPILKAFKKWNWQKYQLRKLLTDQRERVRIKYIEGCKERQAAISSIKQQILKYHRLDMVHYDTQYAYEMKEISSAETELKRFLTVKAQHQKETDERNVSASKA